MGERWNPRAIRGIIIKKQETAGGGKRAAPAGKRGGAVDVRPGDLLQMKKPHPCGCRMFLVLRSGMDFKIRCTKCGHEIMVPRLKCEKNIRKIIREKTEDG